MAVLSETQRRALDKVVQRARDVAEDGARAAIKHLAVHAAEPSTYLSPEERDLRNRLRARARQLGDTRNAKSSEHGIDHLVVECAYEHWHRMLFARFLAENDVLMHPDGVPVTLEECEELAPSAGAADGWELAAWYAAEMLPQIFRPGSPIFEIKLPPEKARELERLLADLAPEVFTASDSLGWVYQFWQAKKKKEVNDSEVKIGADELPAVTQLFTEPYMVQFLLHNTLGAWWVGRHGRDSLPVEMPYLRFLDDGTPTAGTFDGWPQTTVGLRVLDPCCGSGHFLVSAFDILVRFRMAEEGIDAAAACTAALRDNLHGLEIDERCTQIAAFALALAAWTFPDTRGYRVLPELHIACSGLAPRSKKEEWLALAGEDVRLRNGMERLYELFQDAPVLGSLIDPTTVGIDHDQHELAVARFDELWPLLDRALKAGEVSQRDADTRELGVVAEGIVAAAEILAGDFTLLATNVPYLSRVKQGSSLQVLGDTAYTDSKYDLATMFLERNLRLIAKHGTVALVVPQNWLYQDYYVGLRAKLLTRYHQALTAILGAGAFGTISGEVVKPALVTLNLDSPKSRLLGFDCSDEKSPSDKALCLRDGPLSSEKRADILASKDKRIVFGSDRNLPPLGKFVDYHLGLCSGDFPRFGRCFWEVFPLTDKWSFEQTTVKQTCDYGGLHYVFLWESGRGDFYRFVCQRLGEDGVAAWIRGGRAWGQEGVAVSPTGDIKVARYVGALFDNNTIVLTPRQKSLFPAIWAFCSSEEFGREVRKIDKALKVTSGLARVPFDLVRWQTVAAEKYPEGLPIYAPGDPTQWLFKGCSRAATEPLQVAVARLLGYRWPAQADDGLDDLIDADGIVCLPAVRGEQPAAVRLHSILARAFGKEWSAHKQADLLEAVSCKGWTLERWLGERFFQQHCQVFQHRPFIWHIWDGLKKGGFGALVNYHKLDRKLLETLTYNYLGDWIRRQQDGAKRGEDGADERLAAARGLQERIKRILEGEPPCDIFVRWKPIEKQPIGWDPDINDGVRINIRPFMMVDDVGKRGAGVLRDKPNINWGKDRGKDPADAPWYDEFGGDRINDHHLTLALKRPARDASGGRA